MAQEKNGCMIFLGIIVIIWAVGMALAAVAYAGMSLVIGIDFLAGSFTWLGVGNPTIGWLVLGLVVGAFVGLSMGLKRAQRSPGLPVYAGAGVMCLLILVGAYYADPAQSVQSPAVSTPQSATPNTAPTMYIDKIGGNITALRFFEGGQEPPPEGRRVYSTQFARSKTRYIYWLLEFSYSRQQKRTNFNIDEYWYRPDGASLGRQQSSSYAAPGYTGGYSYHAWGARQAGTWQSGTYHLDLYVDGKKVASGQFTIN